MIMKVILVMALPNETIEGVLLARADTAEVRIVMMMIIVLQDVLTTTMITITAVLHVAAHHHTITTTILTAKAALAVGGSEILKVMPKQGA
jgi:hypothetical protein